MTNFLVLLCSTLLLFTRLHAFHESHRAKCTKKRVCNGNLMCAYVCEKGTVQVDPWIVGSLAYQRKLQLNEKLVYFEMPSTHNSAITEADGFGIEKYFISALFNGENLDQGDDIGEGVCQYLSLTDQLRMGLRHLEIDIWWDPLLKDVIVCHSPVPLYPVGNISRAAEKANLTLEWDPKKMSCIGTKRMFSDVLKEVRDWMVQEHNMQELVVLYIDTKWRLKPDQVTKANNDISTIFGPMLWIPSDGNPLQVTVSEMLNQGKRVIIENQKEDWATPSEGEQLVFYPALWNAHQFSADAMTEFPDCAVEGDKDWYGNTWVRALDGSFLEAATRCGVQIVSRDYTNPDDLKFYVWSWDHGEPSQRDGCVALLPSGRWATLDCSMTLPYACVDAQSAKNGDYKTWKIDLNQVGTGKNPQNVCPEGTVYAAPHNAFANSLLVNAAYGQTLWLNAPNPLHRHTEEDDGDE